VSLAGRVQSILCRIWSNRHYLERSPVCTPIWEIGGPARFPKLHMIVIEADTFNIEVVMALLEGIETNLVLAGTWNRTPWRVWLNEPTDSLKPCQWVLEMGDRRFPLGQSSRWEQDNETKSWEQAKSSWRLRSADGRWIPALRDLGADITID
jgi:hypothetical protein